MNKPIKHIIFDLDNTIINERQSALFAQMKVKLLFEKRYAKYVSNQDINLLFSKRNFSSAQELTSKSIQSQLPKDVWRRLYFFELLKNCSFNIDIDELLHEYSIFKDRILHLIPGARNVIGYLHDRYTLSIATNSYTDISALQLDCYFMDIARATDMGVRKPDKIFFEKALQRIYRNKEDVLLIGDDQHEDIYGGKNAGLLTMWFNRRNEQLKESIPKPDYMICSWGELRTIL